MRSTLTWLLLLLSPLAFAESKAPARLSTLAERILIRLDGEVLDVERVRKEIGMLSELEFLEEERKRQPLSHRAMGFCAAFIAEKAIPQGWEVRRQRDLALVPYYLRDQIDTTFSTLQSFVSVELGLERWDRENSAVKEIFSLLETSNFMINRLQVAYPDELSFHRAINTLRDFTLTHIKSLVKAREKDRRYLFSGDQMLLDAVEFWVLDQETRRSQERYLIFVQPADIGANQFMQSLKVLIDFRKHV